VSADLNQHSVADQRTGAGRRVDAMKPRVAVALSSQAALGQSTPLSPQRSPAPSPRSHFSFLAYSIAVAFARSNAELTPSPLPATPLACAASHHSSATAAVPWYSNRPTAPALLAKSAR